MGDFVLKYVGLHSRHEWIATTLSHLRPHGYRISSPVISRNNTYVCDGWTCSVFEPGSLKHGREKEKLDVSRLFHHALSEVDTTNYIPADDRWQTAHRIAWSQEKLNININSEITGCIENLLKQIRHPHSPPTQLIHGDPAGNILFHDGLAPLVIDFSPTIAPVEYAESILIADSIAWHNAPIATLGLLPKYELYQEMLLRAVVFRLAVAAQLSATDFHQTLQSFQSVITAIQ